MLEYGFLKSGENLSVYNSCQCLIARNIKIHFCINYQNNLDCNGSSMYCLFHRTKINMLLLIRLGFKFVLKVQLIQCKYICINIDFKLFLFNIELQERKFLHVNGEKHFAKSKD